MPSWHRCSGVQLSNKTYDFIAWVRGLSPTAGGRVPALALTAMAREADRQQALDAGFNEQLTKPVDLASLLLVLERLLQSAQPRQGRGEPESSAAAP